MIVRCGILKLDQLFLCIVIKFQEVFFNWNLKSTYFVVYIVQILNIFIGFLGHIFKKEPVKICLPVLEEATGEQQQ